MMVAVFCTSSHYVLYVSTLYEVLLSTILQYSS